MESIVSKLKLERNRSSTRATYYCIWKCFNEFFIKLDRKPETWEERLVLFVAYLVEQKKKSTTINSYISAIKAVLKGDGMYINEDRFVLNSLIKACRFVNDQVRTRLPIKKKLLELLILKLEDMFSNQAYLMLYQAMFTTAYHGLFRIGEITLSPHVVKARDVHIGKNKEKLMFVLHTSKTHWKDEHPQIIKMKSLKTTEDDDPRQKNKVHISCPFRLLRLYLEMRGKRKDDIEQFFIFRDKTPVLARHFRGVLREALSALGLDCAFYGSHSLRAGNAVQMLETGISVETIRKLGRWKTNVVYRYLNAS